MTEYSLEIQVPEDAPDLTEHDLWELIKTGMVETHGADVAEKTTVIVTRA